MSREIWKFPLRDSLNKVPLSVGAKVLHVHAQGNDICLWALIEPEAAREFRRFTVYGTGHSMPDDPGVYIGTAHLQGGALVFHVFEEIDADV